MKTFRSYLFVLSLLASMTALQATTFDFFTYEPFGKPFVSDIRSSVIKFEEGFVNDFGEYYFYEGYQKRPFSEGHVGADLPFISYRGHRDALAIKSTYVLTGAFNLIIDSLEPINRMVINTDYWLGAEFRYLFYHPSLDRLKLKNIGLNVMPMYHESTHIGDEFIYAALEQGSDFYRVNVSYESWVVSLTLNDPDTLKGNVFSTRLGMQGVWFPEDGFYQYRSDETQGRDILLSESLMKYWIQFNWIRTHGLGASETFHQVNSVELRNRIKYGYEAEDPERRTWNVNAYFGWEYQSDSDRKVGGYLRVYYGINPHGQFRNIDGYYFIGLSLVLS